MATDAVLEGKLARTALVTTEGFRDVLEIGRQNRPSLYDLFLNRPRPIVPRELRFEVRERIDAHGNGVRPLDRGGLRRLLPLLRAAGVQAVAVSFLCSFLRPDHEREAGEVLAQLGVPVTLSSDLLPEFREYERTSTVVLNAALRPWGDGRGGASADPPLRPRVALPTVDVHTIGAGGGSLARLDSGGALAVGPESAGADPGPARYGRGGTAPTVPATTTAWFSGRGPIPARVVHRGDLCPGATIKGAAR
ncbi:MAG TPA: hypothetical protein ENN53_00705 [Candidatus Acetothermia bacterium]|nr:hypothetical protein [Candidatus Acetothermia bacterium]